MDGGTDDLGVGDGEALRSLPPWTAEGSAEVRDAAAGPLDHHEGRLGPRGLHQDTQAGPPQGLRRSTGSIW